MCLFSLEAFSQVEGDRIMAIVGNEVITESDFQYQVQLYARQNRLTEISPQMAQQLFQSLVTNKILLAKAEQDSIYASDDEVDKELSSRMEALIAQAGSVERLESAYGLPLTRIRNLLKEELRKNIQVEKLKREKFAGGVRVTDNEIKQFFKTYRDSLPDVSEEYELAHIFVERKVSDAEKAEAMKIAKQLLDSIKQGVDFAGLAERNSSDSGSARMGGDLGYAKKGTFVKPFEEAAYSLNVGQVSDIVETEFGYHILKLKDKQGENIRVQHILVSFPKLESSDLETISFLNDLKAKIDKGEVKFEDAVTEFSQDNFTKSKGGYLGKIPVERLDSTTIEALKAVEKGGITDPVRSQGRGLNYGYEIFKIVDIVPPHKLNLEQDYDRIRAFAESYKESQEIEKWIEEIRKSIYVDIKM
jgi:peptidyl-prolyl cis-trans isomerase SurA